VTAEDATGLSGVPEDPLVGAVVGGKYRIDRRVGEGGFGVVYEAVQLAIDARVALKVEKLRGEIEARRKEAVDAFFESARLLTRLKHPNVVSALDLGEVDLGGQRTPYLVMEWCDGRPLKAILADKGRLPMDQVCAVVSVLADALGEAHAMGIAHRDLKPSNVMCVEGSIDLSPRLIDFGIAKRTDSEPAAEGSATTSKIRLFTRDYAAPEQISGERTGSWTDVHALGLLLIELVTGRAPYAADPDPGLAAVDPLRPSTERLGVLMPELAPLIARAVALRPADRYRDARAFREAFETAVRRAGGPLALERRMPSQRPDAATPVDRAARTGPDHAPSEGSIRQSARRGAWLFGAISLTGLLAMASFVAIRSRLTHVDRSPAPTSAPREPAIANTPSEEPEEADSEKAASGATLPHPNPPTEATLCAASHSDLRARLKKIPFPKFGFDPGDASHITSIKGASGAWTTVRKGVLAAADGAERLRLASEILTSENDGLDVLPASGIAYSLTGNCLLLVRGPNATSRDFRETLIAGDNVELRGDTFGGPSPIPLVQLPAPVWNGTPAKRVADLSEGELISRVRPKGLTDARRTGVALELEISVREKDVMIVYASIADAADRRKHITDRADDENPAYFAVDGDIVVAALGPRAVLEKSLLSSVLNGLNAKIEREPPEGPVTP